VKLSYLPSDFGFLRNIKPRVFSELLSWGDAGNGVFAGL
jgi:hypothetical protein